MARKTKPRRGQKSVSDTVLARNWWAITISFAAMGISGYVISSILGWESWVICTGIAGIGVLFGLFMAITFTRLSLKK